MFVIANPAVRDLVDSGEEFSIMATKEQLRDKTKQQCTVRVSNKIRQAIELQGNRLYAGSNSCSVYDHFYIKRCNKCQKYNHYQSECKNPASICGHCSEKHESSSCPKAKQDSFIPCCNNCKASKRTDDMHTHTTFDRTCPSYQAEQNRLRKSIAYYQSNQKN